MARRLGIPRIYLSANSGARLGLAEEMKHLFRVAWEDPANPDKVSNWNIFVELTYISWVEIFFDQSMMFRNDFKMLFLFESVKSSSFQRPWLGRTAVLSSTK